MALAISRRVGISALLLGVGPHIVPDAAVASNRHSGGPVNAVVNGLSHYLTQFTEAQGTV